jgi:hypothetical protein
MQLHSEPLRSPAPFVFVSDVSFIAFNVHFESYAFLPEDVAIVKPDVSYYEAVLNDERSPPQENLCVP